MSSDEFEEFDVYPLRGFRFRSFENEPKLRLLQLSSGPDGNGIVHTYALASEHLRMLGNECLAEAEKLEREN
jgi:hypothetical protein